MGSIIYNGNEFYKTKNRIISENGKQEYSLTRNSRKELAEILKYNPSIVLLPYGSNSGKLYSVLPDDGTGDFTVSRNGTVTYLGSDGLLKTAQANEPRLEFNPDGTFRGVLVEPAATNLLLRSEEFENSYWTKGNFSTITPNATTAPDGTLNADKHVTANVTNAFAIARVPASILDATYTISVFAKAAEITLIQIRAGGFVGNCFCNFDLVQGISGIPSNCVSNITDFGNGWFRCSISYLRNSDRQTIGFNMITSINQGLAPAISGNGVDGYFIWGAQLETGSVATSYIPTVATTITRPADIITRTNAQDLIGQTEGTIFGETPIIFNPSSRLISISDGTISNRITILCFPNRIEALVRVNGSFVGNVFILNPTYLSNNKICIVYTINSIKLFFNGVLLGTNNLFSIPVNLNTVRIGNIEPTLNPIDTSLVKSAAIFKTALSDEQAIALTTL